MKPPTGPKAYVPVLVCVALVALTLCGNEIFLRYAMAFISFLLPITLGIALSSE